MYFTLLLTFEIIKRITCLDIQTYLAVKVRNREVHTHVAPDIRVFFSHAQTISVIFLVCIHPRV